MTEKKLSILISGCHAHVGIGPIPVDNPRTVGSGDGEYCQWRCTVWVIFHHN